MQASASDAYSRSASSEIDIPLAEARTRLKKRMCTHVAWALLVHTALLVLLIGHNLAGHADAVLGHMIIIAMLTMFILIARDFHYRWRRRAYIEKNGTDAEQLIGKFRRDIAILWLLALGLPFFWLLVI